MNTKRFSLANRARCESVAGFNHKLESWSDSDWIAAIAGELGEAANVVKKLNRHRDGVPGNAPHETVEHLRRELLKELADTAIYTDLYVTCLGEHLGDIMIAKFNETSKKHNMPFLAPED